MAEEKRVKATEEEENTKVNGDALSEERLDEASGGASSDGGAMTTESLAGGSIQRTELGEADDTGSIDPN